MDMKQSQIDMVYNRCKTDLPGTIRLVESFNLHPGLSTQRFSGGGEYGPLAYLAQVATKELFTPSPLDEEEKAGFKKSYGFDLLYCANSLRTTTNVARPRNWASCDSRRFIGIDSATGLAFFRMDDNGLCRNGAETDLRSVEYVVCLAYIIYKRLIGEPCPTEAAFISGSFASNMKQEMEDCTVEIIQKTQLVRKLRGEQEFLLAEQQRLKSRLEYNAQSMRLAAEQLKNHERDMAFLATL